MNDINDNEKLEILNYVKKIGFDPDFHYKCPDWPCYNCLTLFPNAFRINNNGTKVIICPCLSENYTIEQVTMTLNKEISRLEKAVKENMNDDTI